MHRTCEPSILYFGTPVVLISTQNEDGTYNIAPISSVFWLGWRCVIGIGSNTQTAANLQAKKECVLNLPSNNEVEIVNRLAMLTGRSPVPARKEIKGYRYEPNKFQAADATPFDSDIVTAPAVKECPVHLEAVVSVIHGIGDDEEGLRGRILNIELKIVKVRVDDTLLNSHDVNRIDPDKWKPLIMSFQRFYTVGSEISPSVLAGIPEKLYKTTST